MKTINLHKHWHVLELEIINHAVFLLLEQRSTGPVNWAWFPAWVFFFFFYSLELLFLATVALWLVQWRLKRQYIFSKLFWFSNIGKYLISSLNNWMSLMTWNRSGNCNSNDWFLKNVAFTIITVKLPAILSILKLIKALVSLHSSSNSILLPDSGNKFLVIVYWSGSTETGSSTMQSSLKTSWKCDSMYASSSPLNADS